MKHHTYRFEKLEVWQHARVLKKEIFLLTRAFPQEFKYEIVRQITRSASSITANIAEGSGRNTKADQAYFVNIAYASGLETLDHLITCKDLELLSEEKYMELRVKMDEILNKINAYYKFLISSDSSLKEKLQKKK